LNFDRIAPYYDFLASLVFFGAIKRSQVENLRIIPPKGKVLIIGGGTGWIIPYIFEGGQVEKLHYVEASQKMLEMAQKKCPEEFLGKVEFILGDETAISDVNFDAIITNFFLDCFEEERLKEIMKILYGHLKEGGHWFVTDFQIDQKWYRRIWQNPLLKLMFIFLKLNSKLESGYLVDFDSIFDGFGMGVLSEKRYFGGFVKSNVRERGSA